MRQKICDFYGLKERSCKEFIAKNDVSEQEAFLIYFEKRCYAYENSCPHTGVNLNWQDEQFFSLDELYLQCSVHGALFKPDTGLCVRGPCQGSHLKPINILIEDGVVYAV